MVKHEGSHVHVLQHSRGSEILVVKELCDLETSSLPTLSLRIQLVYTLYRTDQIQGYVRTEYVSLADGLRTAESTVVSPMDASPPISEETLAESLPPDEGVAEDIADLAEAVDSAEEETDTPNADGDDVNLEIFEFF